MKPEIAAGNYVVETITTQEYKKKILRINKRRKDFEMESDKPNETLHKRNLSMCSKVFLIKRKSWNENVINGKLINVANSVNSVFIPEVVIKKYLSLESGKEKYPELFL